MGRAAHAPCDDLDGRLALGPARSLRGPGLTEARADRSSAAGWLESEVESCRRAGAASPRCGAGVTTGWVEVGPPAVGKAKPRPGLEAGMGNVEPINAISKRLRELDHQLRTAFGAEKKYDALFEIVATIEAGFIDEKNKQTAFDVYHNKCRDMYELDVAQIECVIGDGRVEGRKRAQEPQVPPSRRPSPAAWCASVRRRSSPRNTSGFGEAG